MAATSLRYGGATSTHSGIAAAVGILGLALGSGYALALGEMAGLYVALSLALGVAVLLDFRVGAVLLLLMLPMSSSTLFPHQLMQMTGLNPLNVLVLATLGSYVIYGRLRAPGALVPKQVAWLYVLPIGVGGLIGSTHVHEIPAFFFETGGFDFYTPTQYLLAIAVRPMVIVGVALLIGAAAAQSQRPERFVVPIALSVWFIALIQIGYVIVQAPSIATLASAGERGFYTPMGLHANGLGRLHLFSATLLLFVWSECRRPTMKLFLAATLAVAGLALLLTFSRAAIAGAVVVAALFLMWKFNARTLALCIVAVLFAGLVGADALYMRLTHGFEGDANAISAGRIEGIWLPLLPEVLKSPLWGSGLHSIVWSFPMANDAMTRVIHPHNAYLEALLDMGIIGFTLLAAYYWHVWKGIRRLGSDEQLDGEMRGLFQGAAAALLAFFFTCMFGSSLRPEPESAYLWIAIGLMYGLLARRRAPKSA